MAAMTRTRCAGPDAPRTGTPTRRRLALSSDFKVPGSPDPHWQVVDSRGSVYLLDRLTLKGDKVNTSITLPSHVPDIARVQMWCAWAEVVLGEAAFTAPIAMTR